MAAIAVVTLVAKARRQKLKVFRTPIGFHDAYVAAPSRKAALEAWGAGTDLFSARIAEEVKAESAAAKAALAKPGEIVRIGREGESLPSPRSASRGRPLPRGERGKTKPSRAALDKAEAALKALEERQAVERAELAKDEEKLAKKRRALEVEQAKAREKAETKRDAVHERYREAMRDWVG